METFLSIAKRLPRLYILVDALDECNDRTELLRFLKRILESKVGLNLLITSRKEHEFYVALKDGVDCTVSIQDERVDADICLHVKSCLASDPKLSLWNPEMKEKILTSLTSRAHGM